MMSWVKREVSKIVFSLLEENSSITEREQLREGSVRKKDVVSYFCNIAFKISRHSIWNPLKITEYTEGEFYVKVRLEM